MTAKQAIMLFTLLYMTRLQSLLYIYLDSGIERGGTRGGWNVRSVTEGSAMGDGNEENER